MKKKWLRLVGPLAISALILFIFLRQTPMAELRGAFLRIPIWLLALYLLFNITGTLLRSLRFHVLLSRKIPFRDMFLITLVHNFAVDLLPAQSAALVSYDYFTRKKGIALERGTTSFVMSFLNDMLAMGIMLAALLLLIKRGPRSGMLYIGLSLIIIISLALIVWAQKILQRLLGIKWIARIPAIEKIFKATAEYLLEHQKNSERALVLGLSLLVRSFKYLSLYMLFEGTARAGISAGHFAFFSFGVAATELSALLPIQGVAGIGTWEAVFALVFNQMQFPLENPFLTGLVIHLVTQAWEYSIGLATFLFLSFKFRTSSSKEK